jgi:hypothetical protein
MVHYGLYITYRLNVYRNENTPYTLIFKNEGSRRVKGE